MKTFRTVAGQGIPTACVALTQLLLPLLWITGASALRAQEIDFAVYSETPRLFLTPRRLRLLQRERERESIRWQQFDSLIRGDAVMPEPGFAYALHSRVTGDQSACGKALGWAQSIADPARAADLRGMALVLDWCAIPDSTRRTLITRVRPALQPAPTSVQVLRSQVLTAFAIADDEAKLAETVLRRSADWWKNNIMGAIKNGDDPLLRREDLFAAIEFVHVMRDNLRADLREGAGRWFEDLPARQLLRYYPQPWPAAENEYRIPAYEGAGDPDLREALFSRAAELAIVALDTNAQANQFLQGWLMQDRFLLRSPLGITYEFLWANPYLPGLSFHYMPDLYHANGELYVRSGWDEDANWFAVRKGTAQGFANGARIVVKPGTRPAPVDLGPTRVFFAVSGMRFESGWLKPLQEGDPPAEEIAFVIGLDPSAAYDVEVDDEGIYEARTDAGGILALRFAPGRKAGVRLKRAAPLVH